MRMRVDFWNARMLRWKLLCLLSLHFISCCWHTKWYKISDENMKNSLHSLSVIIEKLSFAKQILYRINFLEREKMRVDKNLKRHFYSVDTVERFFSSFGACSEKFLSSKQPFTIYATLFEKETSMKPLEFEGKATLSSLWGRKKIRSKIQSSHALLDC